MTFHLVAWLIVQDQWGRILLGRRANTSYAAGLWGLPGGHVDPGEQLAETAVRETLEEVGIRVPLPAVQPLGLSRYDLDGVQGIDFFFIAREWMGEPIPLDKTSEVGWFAPDTLPPDRLPWLPAVLEAHLTGRAWLSEQIDGMASLHVYKG